MWVDLAAFDALLNDPDVELIQEGFTVRAALAQSVPLVQATDAWAEGFTGSGSTVAILDTGTEKSHSTFGSRVVSEACYSGDGLWNTSLCPGGAWSTTAPGSAAPCTFHSDCSHGTHVAGIAAGSNGVAKGSSIIAIQVFSKTAFILLSATEADIIAGLERVYALRYTHEIAAANLSLGSGRYTSTCDTAVPAMTAVINNLKSANIATVVSSGNDAYTDAIGWPACISTAISVGNTTKQDLVYSDAVHGSDAASFLKLLAPGTSITSAIPGDGWDSYTGTSMAAPHVTGAWSILRQKSPNASVNTVLSALQSTGKSIVDSRNNLTFKRIRINNALGALPSIRVTSPNGGERWTVGTSRQITWSSSGLNQNGQLYVLLSQDGGQSEYIEPIAKLSPIATSYNWMPARAHATNAGRIFVGNLVDGAYEAEDWSDQNFTISTTATSAPSVSTDFATSISQTGATLNATVNPNGLGTTLYFDYGQSTSYGTTVTYGSVGSGTTALNRSYGLTGLTCGTTYHYRARAQNSAGSNSGSGLSFTTSACPQASGSELITNGSFASGVYGWGTSGNFYADSRFSNCRTCPGYAYVSTSDGTAGNNLVGALYHHIAIPSNATSADLTFWYYISTQETTVANAYDVLNITIQTLSGTYLGNVATFSNLHRNSSYQQYSASLLAYRGQTVRLHFLATTDVSLPTVFRIDDVSLLVTAVQSAPSVSSGAASSIGAAQARLEGSVNPNGAETSLYFDYGTTSAYGRTASYGSVGSGTSSVTRSVDISDLACGTTYHYRARGENSGGTGTGNDRSFTTTACPPAQSPPSLTTDAATDILEYSVSFTATLNPNGAVTTVFFDYGLTTGYGSTITYGLVAGGTDAVRLATTVSRLSCGTTYHYRVRAENSGGATDGGDVTFATRACPPPTITSHPASQTIVIGESATFAVEATSPVPMTYQWYAGASGDTTNPITGATSSTYTTPALLTSATYWVRVMNAHGGTDSNSAAVRVYQPFTDRNLVARQNLLRAVHILELRTRIDALRSRYGLTPMAWTDSSLAGVRAKAVHIQELRSALSAVYSAAAVASPSFTDSEIVSGTTVIRFVHIEELRAAVIELEVR